MIHWHWLGRMAAFAGVMLCLSWLAGTAWCQERDGQVPAQIRQSYPPPGPCPTVCVPNVNTWGHFPTKWRQWPGEQHPEQTNSRSFGGGGNSGAARPRGGAAAEGWTAATAAAAFA